MAALSASTALANTPASDDFNRENLGSSPWSFVDPRDDAFVRLVGAGSGDAGVEIVVPGGLSHDAWNNNRAPRIMQAANDEDFQIIARFDSEPALKYQLQGVIVEQDADNWLRFDFYHDGNKLNVFSARTLARKSRSMINAEVDAGDGSAVRVTRTGDTWTLDYLDGGTQWVTAGSYDLALVVTSVGAFAGNHPNNAPAFTGVVDSFENTASPIVDEDVGAPGPDAEAPLLQHVEGQTGADGELAVTFSADEPVSATLDYERVSTGDLASVSNAALLYDQAFALTGLESGEDYLCTVTATDAAGNVSVSSAFLVAAGGTGDGGGDPGDPGGDDPPVIDVWYGDNQSFGANGIQQIWVDVPGNVSDPNHDLVSLTYTLNGGAPVVMSTGSNNNRLANDGDFVADPSVEQFSPGANTLVLEATDANGNVTTQTVTINFVPDVVPTFPFDVTWSDLASIDEIHSVGHVVDGKWDLETVGGREAVRVQESGYDRLIGLGDLTWTDYEVETSFYLHEQLTGDASVGVLADWQGHTDNPISGKQPKAGYYPLGAIMWAQVDRLHVFGNYGRSKGQYPTTWSTNTWYRIKCRVNLTPDEIQYWVKAWEDGTPEPDWQIQARDRDLDNRHVTGCMMLVAHRVDASFGDVSVTAIDEGGGGDPEDTTPPVISNIQWTASSTFATVTWTTDENATSVVDYGTDASLGSTASNAGITTSHSVFLDNLQQETEYSFRVSSTDASGNAAESSILTLMTEAPGQVATIVGDEFNQGSLDTNVWTFVDAPSPVGTESVLMTGSQLAMSVPAGVEHQVWTSGIGVPRVMQYVDNGDFSVDMKIDSLVAGKYEEQGFIVEQDANNFLRFEIFSDGKPGVRFFAAALHNGQASIAGNKRVGVSPPYYMRVTREGATWTHRYSLDGQIWSTASTMTDALSVTGVGLYAGNALGGGSPEHTAEFDYFRNSVGQASPRFDSDTQSDLLTKFALDFAVQSPNADVDQDGQVDVDDVRAVLNVLNGSSSDR